MADARPWVVVPLKQLPQAKQRLAQLLSPTERCGLVAAMFEDVLAALSPLRPPLLVVCSDAALRSLAAARGARLLDDPGGGLNRAVAAAARWLERRRARSMLLLSGDVPSLTAAECRRLFAVCGALRAPSIGIAADRHGRGTNALWCSPPSVLATAFGPDSARRHIMAATQGAAKTLWLRTPGFSLDIDTPEDLRLLSRRATGAAHTLRFMRGAGLAERLAERHRG